MKNNNATRPIKVVKRDTFKLWQKALTYVIAIVISLVIGTIMLASVGANPMSFLSKVFTIGIVGARYPAMQIQNYFNLFVPLLITSLALSLAFKMRFWNIGGEGQFLIGAIAASAIGYGMSPNINPFLMVLLMCICGGLAAGVYGVFTAILKVKFGTNETLMTLMLNYVALYIVKFFSQTKGSWNIFLDPNSDRAIFRTMSKTAWMTTFKIGSFELNITLILSLLFAVFVYIYLNHTKHGYELNVVGDSINTARYSGMKVGKVIIRTMFLSAFLIGLAGAFKVSTAHALSTSITADAGWTGIVIAWLANLNPLGIIITTALICMLQFGCAQASTTFAVIDSNFADLLQGVILFIILAATFFMRYKLVFNFNIKAKLSKKHLDNHKDLAQSSIVAEQTNKEDA